MLATLPLKGIRAISPFPASDRVLLSVNLARVDLAEFMQAIAPLNFTPQLVQMSFQSGIQIHALLWEGAISEVPPDLSSRYEALASRLDWWAIRYLSSCKALVSNLD